MLAIFGAAQEVDERVDLALSGVPGVPVTLFEHADQLALLAANQLDVVVGELGPLLLTLPFISSQSPSILSQFIRRK